MLFGNHLERIWKAFRGSLENFCIVSGRYLGNINIFLSMHNKYMQIFEYARMKVGKYMGVQVCKYSNVQVFKYASMKVYKYSSM